MRYGEGSGIGTITVDKIQLIAVLRANREGHRQAFEQAVAGFRRRAVEVLNRLIDDILNGKLPDTLTLGLPVPEEHTGDYDRAIRMLDMHVGDHITLNEQAYAQLVDDDWGWKGMFTSTNSYYVGEGA